MIVHGTCTVPPPQPDQKQNLSNETSYVNIISKLNINNNKTHAFTGTIYLMEFL